MPLENESDIGNMPVRITDANRSQLENKQRDMSRPFETYSSSIQNTRFRQLPPEGGSSRPLSETTKSVTRDRSDRNRKKKKVEDEIVLQEKRPFAVDDANAQSSTTSMQNREGNVSPVENEERDLSTQTQSVNGLVNSVKKL